MLTGSRVSDTKLMQAGSKQDIFCVAPWRWLKKGGDPEWNWHEKPVPSLLYHEYHEGTHVQHTLFDLFCFTGVLLPRAPSRLPGPRRFAGLALLSQTRWNRTSQAHVLIWAKSTTSLAVAKQVAAKL